MEKIKKTEKLEKNTAVLLIRKKQFLALKIILAEMNPADIAALMGEMYDEENVDERELTVLYRILPKELAAEAFAYMDSEAQLILINAFSDKELRYVVDELFLDDTVDIIEEMPANIVSKILRNTDAEKRKQINELLSYPEDSAGSVMTTEFVYLHMDYTVERSFDRIRKIGLTKETVYTCYVTENRRLVGIVSLLDMIVSEPGTKIEDIMETNVVSVYTSDDKENAANTLSKYDLAAIPVLDREDRIVGIITFDDAIDVLKEEATEDIEKMAGISPTEKPYFQTSVFQLFKARSSWLLVLMVTAIFTGLIIGSFESQLLVVPALMMFVPMLMDTGGNSGSQSSAMIIRGISLGDIKFSDFSRVVWKEVRVGLACGFFLASVIFAKVIFFDRLGVNIAAVVSLTVLIVVVIAKFVGGALPLIAKKIGVDPAVMASPLITSIVDTLALLIYFFIAINMLEIL
ncbi:MAG: magnesium transporter [Oscillospiraceae bacterium]|nr:magnesium transporter [Oscillospiraceae bacterium]